MRIVLLAALAVSCGSAPPTGPEDSGPPHVDSGMPQADAGIPIVGVLREALSGSRLKCL